MLARMLSFSGSALKQLKLMVIQCDVDFLFDNDAVESMRTTHARNQGNTMRTESLFFFALVLKRNRTLVALDLSDNSIGSVRVRAHVCPP